MPDNGGYSLFTIENARAVKHKVQIGLENDSQIQVIAADLKERDAVVVLGSYELETGMPVSVTSTEGVAQ